MLVGEATYLPAEATTLLKEAGYEPGTDNFRRELYRRFIPVDGEMPSFMESDGVFLSAIEHQEVAAVLPASLFFNHYDINRALFGEHIQALRQAKLEYDAILTICKDGEFYIDYMQFRLTKQMNHHDALRATREKWRIT